MLAASRCRPDDRQPKGCHLPCAALCCFATRRLPMADTTPQNTDRIEKQIVLRAPRERVWNAISDARQFGAWFGVEFESGFVAGSSMKGKIVPTQVDAEIARMQEPHTGMVFQIFVERIEPMRVFAFRWHPFAIDSSKDYSKEPMTLVTFELAEAPGGT